jgi:hypothetical protein
MAQYERVDQTSPKNTAPLLWHWNSYLNILFGMKELERYPNDWGLVNRAAVGVEKEEQVSGAWRSVD